MKRALSINFLFFSLLVLMFFQFVPHHHHNGVACINTEHCKQSCRHNDNQQPDHKGSTVCVAEEEFLISSSDFDFKCGVTDCNDHNHLEHISPLLFSLQDYFSVVNDYPLIKPEYGELPLLYKSAETSRFHGLRAPPFIS